MAILFATKDSAGKPLSFRLVRGSPWTDDFQLTDQATGEPVDLSGVTRIVMRIRKTVASPDVVLELSTTDDTLVITTAATGWVGIRVGSALSSTFPANNHRRATYRSDALIERDGEYEPAIGAKVKVDPSVTRLADDV